MLLYDGNKAVKLGNSLFVAYEFAVIEFGDIKQNLGNF